MAVISLDASRTATAPGAKEGFRPEIQALRALAVLAVLVYHLWPNRLIGGFVGVDIFFVISGYLITAHLLRELADSGTVRLGRFWARRAKRLLPASLLVIFVATIGVLLWVPQNHWNQFLSESVASTLYVQNWFLAGTSVDYMAADNVPSPLQHFWTLSVEEQFYIALPLLLLVATVVGRRLGWRPRRTALTFIAAATLASLAYSAWATYWSGASAYFSTLTRAWEFGIGALLVAVPAVSSMVIRTLVMISGAGAIGAAMLTYGESTPFPGVAAALPVLGTAAIIWSGSRTMAGAAGRFAPVAFLGRISYAVYLWHWPLIALLPWATGRDLTTVDKLAISVASIAIAWVSTTQWEDRVRFSPRLLGRARPRTVLAWSAGAMALVLILPSAVLIQQAQIKAERADLLAQIELRPPPCLGAAAMTDPGCADAPLGDQLVPAPADAPEDVEPRPDCWSNGVDSTLNVCTLGAQENYERRILVVGDSHAKALMNGFERVGEERNWQILLAGRAQCYWTELEVHQPTRAYIDTCNEWRAKLAEFIATEPDIDAIVATKARLPLGKEVDTDDPETSKDAIVQGMTDAWNSRPDPTIPVIALVDNPRLTSETAPCVVENGVRAYTLCAVPRSEAFPPDGIAEAAAKSTNVHVVDLTDLYCVDDLCPPVIGSVVVYRDGNHLTDTYARTLAPRLGDEISAVLDASERRNGGS